jgi:hypothetical protein
VGERIERLQMQAFRGVPGTFELDLDGKGLLVFGENGTGKSSIADALEWYFTGRIELLAHEGRDRATRHVGADRKLRTAVTVTTTGVLGGTITYPPGELPPPRRAAGRETFLLRGRTLADFVNKPKAKKWQALAEILGLEEIDRFRLDLQRARNELRSAASERQAALDSAAAPLRKVTARPSEPTLLQALQERCARADIAPPASIEAVYSRSWNQGVASGDGDPTTRRTTAIRTAAERLDALVALPNATERLAAWNQAATSQDKRITVRLKLLGAADAYLRSEGQVDHCPLCGSPVEAAELAARVRALVVALEREHEAAQRAEDGLREVISKIDAAEQERQAQRDQARLHGVELPELPESPAAALGAALGSQEPVDHAIVSAYADALAGWDRRAVAQLLEQAPPPSDPREALLVEIGVLSEQVRAWRKAERAAHAAHSAFELADQVFSTYKQRQLAHFEAVLRRISAKTAELYGRLHPGEDLDRVGIETWSEKGVELVVEFHGSKQKPPHGVLSESHLNSLAIALFLAMAETFNRLVGFLVLDDVVNSFDDAHRADLADLLASDFEHRQLIVLTHDHLFFKRLIRLAPTWKQLELTSWDFAEGPRTTAYSMARMLDAAQRCLGDGDLHGAAAKGRRALEELLQEVAEALRLPLPFRRGADNDRREAQELLSGLLRGLKEDYKPLYKELLPLLRAIELDVQEALNVEVHAGQDRATSKEIIAALDRIGRLDALWTCADCGTRVWRLGSPAAASCKCRSKRFPPREGEWLQPQTSPAAQ